MGLFDTDIVERDLLVRQTHNIEIEQFSPNFFYKWIWKEKGVEYPLHYSLFDEIPDELLRNILMDKLGEIPADVFIKWEEDRSAKHFRRYFKKLIKREYMPALCINFDGKDVRVVLRKGFGHYMTIIFHRK